jgi:SAM-dependent methyltransferase
MPVTVLFPHFDHPAIEERYASWQSRLLLREGGAEVLSYALSQPASEAVAVVDAEHVVVVTDPLVLASPNLPRRLVAALSAGIDATVPVTNEPGHPAQRRSLAPYVTLRELQSLTADLERQEPRLERALWDRSDPAVFACRTEMLDGLDAPMTAALAGRQVGISTTDYIHRWASMRGQLRGDLLDRIDTNATSILEFGCGEGTLGAALKARQRCRVVGIELDREAAAIARKRIDDVYCGDVREIVDILDDKFDWIIGGDIIEHLDDPWSFLADLRRITAAGGRLLLSLPNIANAALINDLLAGRFDYVYMGLTCAGHLRFFTRQSIGDLLAIAGWSVERIEAQPAIPSPGTESLVRSLEAANLTFSRQDLLAHGYYVIARND